MEKTVARLAWALIAAVVVGQVSSQDTINVKESIERIKKCYPSTADLNQFNKCLFGFWQEVRPLLLQGIPDLGIPKVEPLYIDKIDVADTGSLVQGKAMFTNVTVRGLSSYVPKRVEADLPSQTITVEISIPEVNVEGIYNVDGTVMLMPVKGDGDFWLKVEGVEGKAVAHIERIGTGLGLARTEIDFSAQKFSGRLNNLLGGEEVGDSINKMINDNAQDIFQDVKPLVTSRISEVMDKVLQGSIKHLPAEAFILPEGFVPPDGVDIPADFVVATPKA